MRTAGLLANPMFYPFVGALLGFDIIKPEEPLGHTMFTNITLACCVKDSGKYFQVFTQSMREEYLDYVRAI